VSAVRWNIAANIVVAWIVTLPGSWPHYATSRSGYFHISGAVFVYSTVPLSGQRCSGFRSSAMETVYGFLCWLAASRCALTKGDYLP
jgi:hypothetical protein